MDQKQQYTEFWKFLSLTEDFLKYRKKSGSYDPPEFRSVSEQPVPAPSLQEPEVEVKPNTDHPLVPIAAGEDCVNCAARKMGKDPVPAIGSQTPALLVLCGPPSVNAEQNHVPLAAEEMDYFLKWMAAIDLDLEKDVLLMNFPRCRMPGNRPPFPEELNRCARYLPDLIKDHKPVLVLTLGPVAASCFMGSPGQKVSELRDQIGQWQDIPVIATYSPDQVLTYDELKRPVWEDLKKVRELLNGSH